METKDSKKETIKLSMVAMIIVAFLVFFVLKVNGHFDFTHNYGIRDISASVDGENVMLMIDKDHNTLWNAPTFLGETKFKPGDVINVSFDDKREISGIVMYGRLPEDVLFMTGEEIPIELTAGDGEYRFIKPVTTDTLVITISGTKEESFNIAELEVY